MRIVTILIYKVNKHYEAIASLKIIKVSQARSLAMAVV